MKRFAAYLGLVLSLVAHQAVASELYLMVFLGEAPLQGVEVKLDERNLGTTDSRGSKSTQLDAGSHVITLVDDDIELPIPFQSGAEEDVEISVTFSTTAGATPKVNVRKFTTGVPGGEGFITGKIVDPSGAAIIGATIAAPGANVSATTDEFGVYVLQIPRGAHDIVVNAPGFQQASASNIRVMEGLGVNATVTLRPEGAVPAAGVAASGALIEEVFVLGVFNPQDNAASVERYATSITNAIDIAQIERFGDNDIGGLLGRMVGVAVIDRKYATVRGLDGRYISSTLNGLLMPSTDTQRREVELDLFPSNIVEGIEIQKSFTADQLASTTGGAINIQTKGIPDERILQVSGSLGYNPGTTGNDILSYASSNDDWAGFDSGLREMPNGVLGATRNGRSLTICDPRIDPVRCTSPDAAAQLGLQFQDDYRVGDKTALPNGELGVVYGDRLPTGNGSDEWGFYLAAELDRRTTDRGDAELTNPTRIQGNYERSAEETAITAYAAVGYDYGDANSVISKTMYLHNTDDITRVDNGLDTREDRETERYLLDWVERQFLSQSFSGHNEIDRGELTHKFDWRMAYSETERDQPDRRAYTYFNNRLSSSAFERRWSDLNETSTDLGADYALALDWGSNSSTEFQFGAMWSDKDRDFDQYRFGIAFTERGVRDIDLTSRDIENDILPYTNFALSKVVLTANTTNTDSYESQEETQAGYFNSVTDIGDDWSVVAGVRFEKFDQTLDYPNAPNASNELEYDDWYPSLNVTWRSTEELQFRVGYSQTVSYPGIIERSEAQTYDPDNDNPIFGNPLLEVSTIDNYDVRAEYYFSDTESISLAFFYKDIDTPVERAIPDASGSSALDSTTFINQESAELFGVEIDGTKDVLARDDYLVFVAGNISYIDSEVTLTDDSKRLEGASADGRQLQGQSEWLSNLQVGLDHYPTEQKFTLLINFFDDRIFRVVRGAATGPEYEDGRMIVDFTYEKIWNDNLVIDASIRNIFNEKIEYSQNDITIESYDVGTFFKAGLTYKF